MTNGESASSHQMSHAIRPMELRDIAEVAEIEREAFPTTWPPTAFRKELTNRLARYLVAFECREEGAPAPGDAVARLPGQYSRCAETRPLLDESRTVVGAAGVAAAPGGGRVPAQRLFVHLQAPSGRLGNVEIAVYRRPGL